MLFRVDFCLIAVSNLHKWFWNYTCCFETPLKIVEMRYCHVEKIIYLFTVGCFPFYFMLFRNPLVLVWLCIMLFWNHTVWLQKYTACGINRLQYSSNFFLFYDMCSRNCYLWFQVFVTLFWNDTVWLQQYTMSFQK